ncbi:tripartite motif-containing protein 16-like protein [Amphiprion ocellaris]|uniref:tripartite motif-containing protein 16-like protein n=1 Tax=Amphiprion ocellaris TaxID=80972 RepID=UPI000C305010|nr:tripartite motif-containing protein 16-like protein [Amphiprion ocellaris]
MAQSGMNLYSQSISCSICLDLLKDPVALSCGHSYCMKCIETHWDGEDLKTTYSCPQCRKTFTQRPVLDKNVLLAELVEELKKTGLQAAAADHCYAGDEDVSCDVCTGRKMKAVKSCLVCLVSYCEKHLQPHYESPAFKKHQLVEPSKNLQENICSRHDEVKKMIHPTDHKDQGAAERMRKKLEESRLNIQQRIQDRQKDVKLLQQEMKDIRVSADKTVEDSKKMFSELIHLIQNRSSEVEQQIRSQQETEESRVKELQEKLEQEIRDLERKDAELKQISDLEDHTQFLHKYPSVSALSESKPSSSINIQRPLRHFEDVTAAVKELRGKLEDVLKDTWTNISPSDVLPPQPEPQPALEPEQEPTTRAGFLKYFQEITLDPNTAHTHLVLSDKNRRVTLKDYQNFHPDHPDRFTDWFQVLSRESLTGRCYWEVEWRGGGVYVAVTYKNVRRTRRSRECGFGLDDRSWSLYCDGSRYTFWYKNTKTPVSGRPSSRIGVYLDHGGGILSFYSVSQKMKLLHRVQTTFTEPLHAGLWLYNYGDAAKFIDLQ